MPGTPRLSVIVAVEGARPNVPAVLERCAPQRHPEVEFIVCFAGDGELDSAPGNVRVLHAPAGSRIPHLWRDGIRAARGAAVATTTAHCVPGEEWVERLLAIRLDGDLAGVGGLVENPPDAGPLAWAIYLQRYARYTPGRGAGDADEIAADNAVYRREAIVAHGDLLEDGFWEPNFHARFRRSGLRIAIEPGLRVVHRNCYGLGDFLAQRIAHGREFGHSRAARESAGYRLFLLLASPALAVLFFAKIVLRALRDPHARRGLPGALAPLTVCVAAWGAGEALGYVDAVRAGARPPGATSTAGPGG